MNWELDPDEDEEEKLQEFLDVHPCTCGAITQMTGDVLYADPLQYKWKCVEGHRGIVFYTTLKRDRIRSDGAFM